MKRPNPELIDAENPEWSAADFKRARPASEVLPESIQAKLGIRRRGPQKTPTKVPVTIRLSPDVLEKFKARGTGWQSRVDDALRDWLKTHAA
ncbi:hypothetical protein PIGHUM_03320 [Pigmentiphaga humi]|uniref:BrnA antitoxin of type II toxin-antitoxin system n=1 Tax=Pigmentiphaga humi TaxID=2478468 RepID=A0A3P4B4L0_9BURK|nr:BrnA antitoxin family protein [Pigmentiphaga humi]VCU71239.1 hypothetical protein PIGHUM_03320 [Pigmentiphaga humi]